MPFDGPAAVLMEAGDSVDQQTGDHSDPTVFFVNVREPLRRFDEVSGRVACTQYRDAAGCYRSSVVCVSVWRSQP